MTEAEIEREEDMCIEDIEKAVKKLKELQMKEVY